MEDLYKPVLKSNKLWWTTNDDGEINLDEIDEFKNYEV